MVHLVNQKIHEGMNTEKIELSSGQKREDRNFEKDSQSVETCALRRMKWHASEQKELQGRLFTPLLAHARPVYVLLGLNTANKALTHFSWHFKKYSYHSKGVDLSLWLFNSYMKCDESISFFLYLEWKLVLRVCKNDGRWSFRVYQQGEATKDVSSCELCSDDNRVSIKRFSINYYFLNTFDVSQKRVLVEQKRRTPVLIP